jgi:PAS domain S-box-containing protein
MYIVFNMLLAFFHKKNGYLRFYTTITGLGFIAVIGLGLFFYSQFRAMMGRYGDFTKECYSGYVENLNLTTLASMARYIEKRYPVLRDPEKLRQEAGTDWFWGIAGEWKEITRTFGFAYIYYIEKTGDGYVFLLSSDIRPDYHPEWLHGPVWAEDAPVYVDRAYESGELCFSPEPVVNEWGILISAVLPIMRDGKAAGILGVDYNAAFMDGIFHQERLLSEREDSLSRAMLLALILAAALTVIIMAAQIIIGWRSVLIPAREREAGERVRMMMDATPMACSIRDAEGKVLDCNLEALNIFGLCEKKDFLERFNDLNPEFQNGGERSRDKAAALIKAALETGRQRFDWMYLRASGESLPVETTLVRVPWKQGYQIAAYSRDLREVRAREAEAEEMGERMKAMLDTMAFACFFFDAQGNPVDCNQRALALYGCHDKKEFLGNFFCFSPEFQSGGRRSVEKAREHIKRAFDTGKEVFMWDHIKADGTPLPAEITLIRVDWKDGYRVVAYARDLTRLVETEDRMARVLSVIEGSPNLTFYISAGGDIEYMNPAISRVTGFSREELSRDGLGRIFSPEDFRRLSTEYFASALENRMINFEMDVYDKTGERRDFSFSAFSVRLHNGKRGLGFLGRDVTELKRLQRELIAARAQAERALAEEIRYNRAKSDFLSRVSHEMRTPMNAIIGMAGIGKRAVTDRERRRCFNEIEEASNRLLGIVNNILDMTGVETGAFDFTPGPFNFAGAMAQVIEAARARAAAKNQTLVTDIDGAIPEYLISDEGRLKQALLHMLSNAVKFTPRGETLGLSARLLGEDGGGCLVRFEVWDRGPGIEAETLRRLWEAFEQGDNSITRRFDGLGLGLPLTKRIVELMGGEIRVESGRGKGSRFICDLCFAVAAAVQEEAGTEDPGGLDLTGRRILVVDDMAVNRDILFALLDDTGAELDGAENGEAALRMFSQKPYDLVLMDLHMPVLDGFAAARRIRDSALPWAGVPVILVSAESRADLLARCGAYGDNDRLAKPVEPETLKAVIAKWLRPRTLPAFRADTALGRQ